MRTRRPIEEKLVDLAEGRLKPAERDSVAARAAGDPRLARELAVQLELQRILSESLDVAPPADLTTDVLRAIHQDRARRARAFRLPNWFEQSLVLAGAGGLASLVAIVGRSPQAAPGALLGDLAVGTGEAADLFTRGIVLAADSATRFEWVPGVVQTLTRAGWSAFGPSAEHLVIGTLGLTVIGIAAFAFRRGRRGGLRHASLFA
ncbi:MAG: hypothetical protein R3B81_14010 [bacterium]